MLRVDLQEVLRSADDSDTTELEQKIREGFEAEKKRSEAD